MITIRPDQLSFVTGGLETKIGESGRKTVFVIARRSTKIESIISNAFIRLVNAVVSLISLSFSREWSTVNCTLRFFTILYDSLRRFTILYFLKATTGKAEIGPTRPRVIRAFRSNRSGENVAGILLTSISPQTVSSKPRAVILHKKNPPVDRDDHARAISLFPFFFKNIFVDECWTTLVSQRVAEKNRRFSEGGGAEVRGYSILDSHEARIAKATKVTVCHLAVIPCYRDEIVKGEKEDLGKFARSRYF